jgi:hypothetical protein
MIAKREAQRRRNWFMSVVKVKAFASKLLKRARDKIKERNKLIDV